MSREPNAKLIAIMEEAKVSNKGLAKRMQETAAQRGLDLGTTHVAVQRWRNGTGIRPQAAVVMADVLGAKLGRRITPADLGFFDLSEPATPQGVGYPSSVPDALSMLGGLTREPADARDSSHLAVSRRK